MTIRTLTSGASAGIKWPSRFEDLPVLLTQVEVAQLFGISERTLERRRHTGKGIRFCKIGRRVLYYREEVVRHLLGCSFENTAEARAARGGK
jgi:excisionase family DNA binding protein